MKIFPIILAISLAMLSSCGFWDDTKVTVNDHFMVKLRSAGKSIKLNDSTVISFTYDFELGQHEVTQQEFEEVMGFNPVLTKKSDPANLQAPVANITYFDMVRYCNALSKKYDLDTVYHYLSYTIDSLGSTKSISGLTLDRSKNGFRLPTEAEWEFAARLSNGVYPWGNESENANNYAWFGSNSDSKLHSVCSLDSINGFCDLAGNALEWVEDYYGNIPSDSISNYIGPSEPPADRQRVVKGGGIYSSIYGLLNSARKDVYPILLKATICIQAFV